MQTVTHESYLTADFNSIGVKASYVSTVMIESVGLYSSEWLSLLEVRSLLPSHGFFCVSLGELAAVCVIFVGQSSEHKQMRPTASKERLSWWLPCVDCNNVCCASFRLNLFLPGIIGSLAVCLRPLPPGPSRPLTATSQPLHARFYPYRC